ncbi:MAG TPA: hypothetical protein VFW79_07575 [Cellulomonas sp.]|uniref:hypothetical protein n=1 Tax=Cellulomonas sp. TaxID=40001 RepID=UPI002E34383D|nr:hypothetical protein [Cellulomonas sp.]HEX5332487.1 hypothetical protein [Cellulomonas sp.]
MRGQTAARLATVAAAVTLLVGCSSDTSPIPSPATIASAADCLAPQVIADLGLRADARELSATSHPDVPDPGAVPAGFEPVSVVECTTGERLTDAQGVWDAITVRHLEGDLAPLLAALAAPRSTSTGDQLCPATDVAASELWLVDALGRAVRPAPPVDACGAPMAGVRAAVAALAEIEVTHYRVHLAASRATVSPTTQSTRLPTPQPTARPAVG